MTYSIVYLSDVRKARRFDAEYFQPEYLEIEEQFNDSPTLLQLSDYITNGHTPYEHNLQEGSVKFITAEFVEDFRVQNISKFILAEHHQNYLRRSQLNNGDIIFTIKGKIGNAVPIFNVEECLNINQDIAKLRIKKDYNIFYISAFLNSTYGKLQTKRVSTGQINPFVGLNNLHKIKIPLLSQNFQKQIEHLVKQAHHAQDHAKQLYKQAETLLLRELGLCDYEPQHQLTFQTTKREVDEAKRFDAEYFQPKYDEIIQKIEGYKGGCDIVKNIFSFNNINFFPKKDKLYHYIPLSKVSNTGEIEVSEQELGDHLPTRARRKVKEGDIILSSIRGSLETSALIQKEHQDFIVSNGFYVFHSQKINSETLLVLFKSKIMIELLQRISKGTILGGYDITTFENLKIPLITASIQETIAQNITESQTLRKHSKALLQQATQAVETAIECGEQEAFSFLKHPHA